MNYKTLIPILLILLLSLLGCNPGKDRPSEGDPDAGPDTDVDSDTDSDSDSDMDTDTDTDTNIECPYVDWAKSPDGVSSQSPLEMGRFSDDSFLVAALTMGNVVMGEGEPTETELQVDGAEKHILARYSPNGDLLWARTDLEGDTVLIQDVETLSDDTFLVAGFFNESLLIAGSGDISSVALQQNAEHDIFIARYTSDGTLMWAKSLGGDHTDRVMALSSTDTSFMLLGGSSSSSLTFGAGESNETTLGSSTFVAKYNLDGSLVWAKTLFDDSQVWLSSVTSTANGSFAVTGSFSASSVVLGAGEINETTLTLEGAADLLVAKYDADGLLQWALSESGGNFSSIIEGREIEALSDGSFAVGFLFGSSGLTLAEGEPTEQTIYPNPSGTKAIGTALYSSDGSLQWARSAGWGQMHNILDMDVNSSGVVSLCGYDNGFWISGEPSPPPDRGWVVQYSSTGSSTIVGIMTGTSTAQFFGVVTLEDDSLVALGRFADSVQFGVEEFSQADLMASDSFDLLISRMSN